MSGTHGESFPNASGSYSPKSTGSGQGEQRPPSRRHGLAALSPSPNLDHLRFLKTVTIFLGVAQSKFTSEVYTGAVNKLARR